MDAFAKAVGGMFLVTAALFLGVIIGTLGGGIVGWIVGLMFGDTILGIASQLGIRGVTMFQLGCFLGFVGGFLKTKVDTTVKAAS